MCVIEEERGGGGRPLPFRTRSTFRKSLFCGSHCAATPTTTVTAISIPDHTYTMDFFLEVSWEDYTPAEQRRPVPRAGTSSRPSPHDDLEPAGKICDNLDPAGKIWPPKPSRDPQDYDVSGWNKVRG